jgi:Flp pilus assembly protein TadG
MATSSFWPVRRLKGLTGESGQVLPLAAIGMAVIISFLGLAVDVGHIRYVKRNLQLAADAAALAGALEVQSCLGANDCSALQAAAQNALTENGLSGSTVIANCASTAGSGLTVMVNNPACALGAADPNYNKSGYVEVIASESVPTYFARIVGWNNVPISARAEASRTGGAACIYALDPSASGAISVDLLASISSPCGIVDESSSSSALTCLLLSSINASYINITGGAVSLLCSTSPSPKTSVAVPTPADPLAYLPKPSRPACGTSTGSPYHGAPAALNIVGSATLYADGAYCGGINIAPGANVTFQPGTYVLTSSNGPGGLSIDLLSNVSGTGVTFYNYGPSGGVNFPLTGVTLGSVDLVAPTSGTYSGILFFQDPQNTSTANISGTSALNTTLEGAYYFPTARVTFALSGPANYNILVANDIDFAILTFGFTHYKTSGFSNNYSSLANGSPIGGIGAVLVQ